MPPSRTSSSSDAEHLLQEKQELRNVAKQRRAAIPASERLRASAAIQACVLKLAVFRQAKSVHSYVSFRDEVATLDLIAAALQAGKQVVAPRVAQESRFLQHYALTSLAGLRPGRFGILEPDPASCEAVAPQNIDLVLVPGLAFDRRGNRLGYGKGYYDRFLSTTAAPRIALAFDEQLFARIPAGHADIRVDAIVTPSQIITTTAARLTGRIDSDVD